MVVHFGLEYIVVSSICNKFIIVIQKLFNKNMYLSLTSRRSSSMVKLLKLVHSELFPGIFSSLKIVKLSSKILSPKTIYLL